MEGFKDFTRGLRDISTDDDDDDDGSGGGDRVSASFGLAIAQILDESFPDLSVPYTKVKGYTILKSTTWSNNTQCKKP